MSEPAPKPTPESVPRSSSSSEGPAPQPAAGSSTPSSPAPGQFAPGVAGAKSNAPGASMPSAATSRPIRRPVIVAPDNTKRDTIIAVASGLIVLALVLYAIVALKNEQGKPSTNQVTGVIVAKHASGEREQEISVGKKGVNSQETDSGFSFEIRVEAENRSYEVPVNEGLYRSKKVGDQQSFIRPPSEQK